MARALALSAALIAALALPQAAAAGVLVVGDSLEVGTGPHLKRELAGTRVTVDAASGARAARGCACSPGGCGPSRAWWCSTSA